METLESITGVNDNFWNTPKNFDYLFRKEVPTKYTDDGKIIERTSSECRQIYIPELYLVDNDKSISALGSTMHVKDLYLRSMVFCGNNFASIQGKFSINSHFQTVSQVGNVMKNTEVKLHPEATKSYEIMVHSMNKLYDYLLVFHKKSVATWD